MCGCLTLWSQLTIKQLIDTKSKDKRINLMHHVAKTVQESYPDISDFASEFTGIHKASTGADVC